MISPRWRKVLQDLWLARARTTMVVISIAVGVFAVGVIASTRIILFRDLNASYQQSNPQSGILYASPFDDELLDTVRRMPDVAAAEGRSSVQVRVQHPSGEWKNLHIVAISDFRAMQVNRVFPQSGTWPPGNREILIERASLGFLGLKEGDRVRVETPDHKQYELRVAGLAYDVSVESAAFSDRGSGYVTPDTLEWLGKPRTYTDLLFTVRENPLDAQHIQKVADGITAKVKAGGRVVNNTWIPTPGKHPVDEVLSPLALVLQVIGILTLLLSGFLVVNTVAAVLSQHVRQIGMMKAIGARRSQLVCMYAGMVLSYGLMALLTGVPLGYLGTRTLVTFMAGMFNLDISSWAIPGQTLLLQAAIAFLVPLLAALVPVLAGTRVSVREAVNDYGIGKAGTKKGLVDRLVERVRGLSRPMLLSLRNTFRRKGRLVLSLIVLTLGGALFIGVFSVRASLLLTLDEGLRYFDYDVAVTFDRPQPMDLLKSEALGVPGAVEAESWRWQGAALKHGPDRFSPEYSLVALPATSGLVQPKVLRGRWLLPDDENAVVLNADILRTESRIRVGDEITLRIGTRETTWKVVGFVSGALGNRNLYVSGSYFGKLMNDQTQAELLYVRMNNHTKADQLAMARRLEEHFNTLGVRVSNTTVLASWREMFENQFRIISVFLLLMSMLMAVVGALGLAGIMSINVLERTREIGVLRAIGASNGAIYQIVIGEGLMAGVSSWMLGTLLALPISKLLGVGVGIPLVKSPLAYQFSVWGAVLWLVVMLMLAAFASYLPARRAARLSVREVLAYE